MAILLPTVIATYGRYLVAIQFLGIRRVLDNGEKRLGLDGGEPHLPGVALVVGTTHIHAPPIPKVNVPDARVRPGGTTPEFGEWLGGEQESVSDSRTRFEPSLVVVCDINI